MKVSSTFFALISAQTTDDWFTGTTTPALDTDDSLVPVNSDVATDPVLEDSLLQCFPEGLSLNVPGIALRNLGFENNGIVAQKFSIGEQWNPNCTFEGAYDTDGQFIYSSYDTNGQFRYNSNGQLTDYYFFAKHGDCDIITTTNDTHIFYNGVLRGRGGYNDGVISREREYELDLKCEFSRDTTVSIESFFTPIIRYVDV